MKTLFKLFLTTMVILAFSTPIFPQVSISAGADIYSRYNWRGLDFGDAASFQPTLSLGIGNFSIGAWGAYSFFSGSTPAYNENDLFATYEIETESAGSFTIIYTDYYYPYSGASFFKYNVSFSHVLEGGLSYSGPEKFPVELSAYYNIKNDPDKSAYIQVGYPATVVDVSLSFYAGFTPDASEWYATTKAGFINLGVTATKNVEITEKFSLPVHIAYILNPYAEQSTVLVGLSL